MSGGNGNDLERTLVRHLGAAACLSAAERLEIFSTLACQPCTTDDLSIGLKLAIEPLQLLLRVLELLGVIESVTGRWQLSVATRSFLAGQSQIGADSFTRLWARWDTLEKRLSGQSMGRDISASRAQTYAQDLSEHFIRAGPGATELGIALRGEGIRPGRILDLGAGSGVWGIGLRKGLHASQVIAVDQWVVANATTQARSDDGASNWRAVPADLYHLPFRRAFDLIVVANVLHLLDQGAAVEMLTQAKLVAAPGCFLVVVEPSMARRDEAALGTALYGLDLLLRVPGSGLYSQSELVVLLRRSGFAFLKSLFLTRMDEPTVAILTRLG